MTAPVYYPQQPYAPGQQPPPTYMPQQPYAPPYPPQGVAQPQPGYYQQPAPAQPAQPSVPLATGSIDSFYQQPSTGGGKGLKFEQIGARHIGRVARDVTNADVQQIVGMGAQAGQPQFFRDGRPKFQMLVPLEVHPQTPGHPDGVAVLYVKGQMRDELTRAMAEAGAPAGPPRAGALIDVSYVSQRSSGQGMSPSKVYAIIYTLPPGTSPVAPSPVTGSAPSGAPIANVQQAPTPPPAPSPQPPQPAPPAQPQPPAAPLPPPAPSTEQLPLAQAGPQNPVGLALPPGMDPAQAQLYASLVAAQTQAPAQG